MDGFVKIVVLLSLRTLGNPLDSLLYILRRMFIFLRKKYSEIERKFTLQLNGLALFSNIGID